MFFVSSNKKSVQNYTPTAEILGFEPPYSYAMLCAHRRSATLPTAPPDLEKKLSQIDVIDGKTGMGLSRSRLGWPLTRFILTATRIFFKG